MTSRLPAVLALALAASLVSSQAMAAKPRSAARPGGEWLQVETLASGDTVARLYREQLLAWYRDSGTLSSAELASLPDAEYFAFRPDLTRFAIESGELAGQWTFSPPQNGRWPDSAVQVVDRSDAGGYRIVARVHCQPGAAACRKLREEAVQMAPPEPSTDVASAGYAAWQSLVMSESCTPAPVDKAPPPYPTALARSGEGGRVVLRLLVNPCGEVRAVRLDESSGVPRLDQATIDTAWRWRLYAQRQASGGAIVKVPVDFVPPQLDGAPSGRVDRAAR